MARGGRRRRRRTHKAGPLAELTSEEVAGLLPDTLPALTPHTVVSRERLADCLPRGSMNGDEHEREVPRPATSMTA
jgi:hypothetical protein